MQLRRNRADGYYIKNINPYQKLMPYIMPNRCDAQNMTQAEFDCAPVDKFIKEQNELGNNYNFMHVFIASLVRLYAIRPCLNRFVMKKKIYQHYDITLAFVIKKRMTDDSEDTVIKLHFDGSENLEQIKQAVDKAIADNTPDENDNSVDKMANTLARCPHWLMNLAVGAIKWLDGMNLLSKSMIESIPFHNSVFVTFLKSIKGDALYHHCYDYGSTSAFFGVGKEQDKPVVSMGEIAIKRMLPVGIVTDERFCDGLYFVNSLRVLRTILKKPQQLLKNFDLSKSDGLNHATGSKAYRKNRK